MINQQSVDHIQPAKICIVNNMAVKYSDVVVYKFKIGDVEDPEIYAGQHLWDWEHSEAGQWIMENAESPPRWIYQHDYNTWSYNYAVIARLSESNQTFFRLKWGRQ